MKEKQIIEKLLKEADIIINGDRPFDIKVHNEALYGRVLGGGTLALGEAYMDGWWDCERLDELFNKTLRAGLEEKFQIKLAAAWTIVRSRLFNRQNKKGAKEVAIKHYDLDNDLYFSFLDPYKQYSCAYFKDTQDLSVAQVQKLRLICDKLQLKPGEKVLDIGCGWGGLAKFMAENYGCEVTGITISKEQAAFAREFTKNLPVTIKEIDYRDLKGQYDKIVSVGMFEHVGHKNYKNFLKIVRSLLKDDGLFLLHTIGGNQSVVSIDPWINKYIFPNATLPSLKQMHRAAEGVFVLEDLHNFGAYYDLTLMAWHRNFEASWPNIRSKYNERFYRMFRYYLLCCAGIFRARQAQLWQFVFSKKGVSGAYASVR